MELSKLIKDKKMQVFLWVWAGQVVSILGSAMTRFALMIWAYEQSGSATTLALIGTFNSLPYLLFSPLAGVLIDRWDRRKIMLFADLFAGFTTVFMLVMYKMGSLELWHMYLAEGITGALEAFQIPAYSAIMSVLVPKEQYTRTNGLRSLGAHMSYVLAPALAGLLLPFIQISGVMTIDIATFLFSTLVLLCVSIPKPPVSEDGSAVNGNLKHNLKVGLEFIFKRKGLTHLLLLLLVMNMLSALTYFSILPAMVLARSGDQETALGWVQSMLATGGVIGSALLSIWGGPRKKIHGVLFGGVLTFLLGDLLFGIGRDLPIWIIAALGSTIPIPFISGEAQTIWQLRVPPNLQGRVFSTKDMIQQITSPVMYLVGGILADQVFEPAFLPGGKLVDTFAVNLVGSGPGAGMGFMFLFTFLLGTTSCLLGFLSPALRNVEKKQ